MYKNKKQENVIKVKDIIRIINSKKDYHYLNNIDDIVNASLLNESFNEEELEDMFNNLIDLYNLTNCDWVDRYNNVIEEDNIKTKINDSVYDCKKDHRIVKIARCLQLSNRAAHSYQFMKRKIISSKVNIERNPNKFKVCEITFDRYVDKFAYDENEREKAKNKLIENFGFSEKKLDEIKENVEYCRNASQIMYNIKNILLKNLMRELSEEEKLGNDQYSYGYIENCSGAMFIMDVPGYSQFNVHLKLAELIDFSKNNLPVYDKEIVNEKCIILAKGINSRYKNLLKINLKERKKILEKKKNSEKHIIAVAAGANRKQLNEILEER